MPALCSALAAAHPSTYAPREVGASPLQQAVRTHMATFVEVAEQDGQGLPAFVIRAFDKLTRCGDPTCGFARFRCDECAYEHLVPLSCKVRGLCASCGGRRMTAQARHIVEQVLPVTPVRQWVLTLPHPLRYRAGYDAELCRTIHRAFVRKLHTLYRKRARKTGLRDGLHGAVTAIHRFGGALNLNVHYHTLVPDGTFHLQSDGTLFFQPLSVPTQAEVERVLTQVVRAVIKLCARRGLLDTSDPDPLQDAAPTLAACYDSAVRQRVALGPRRGQPVLRLGQPWTQARAQAHERVRRDGLLSAELDGFTLHGRVSVAAEQPTRLEKLVRYCMRPALAEHRLQATDDGRYRLELKSAWRDGTTHLRLDPMELMERLAAQVPRPRVNLVLYSGVFAPRAHHRAAVVAFGRPPSQDDPEQAGPPCDQPRHERERWAELMRHAFELDVLQCPRCPGRLTYIATITHPPTAKAILRSLGQPDSPADLGRPSTPGIPRSGVVARQGAWEKVAKCDLSAPGMNHGLTIQMTSHRSVGICAIR